MLKFRPIVVAACFLSCFLGLHSPLAADEGNPLAIRFWPDHGVTLESMWDLHVAIRLNETNRDRLPRVPDYEMGVSDLSQAGQLLVLDRKPNQKIPSIEAGDKAEDPSGNAVKISQIKLAAAQLNMIEVDGVRVVDAQMLSAKSLMDELNSNAELANRLSKIDVLLLAPTPEDLDSVKAIAKLLTPRIVVVPGNVDLKTVDPQVQAVEHNTLAVSTTPSNDSSEVTWVTLSDQSWKPNAELAGLFEKKEKSSKDSRAVFEALSVKELNFRPGNGTHTPRWNTEHMMGRELLFFSQIYHAVDPSIPVMDVNPKQMPEDYVAAHPQWTGLEEAYQTQRVEDFTRRYAYLLDGLDLDKKPKGSRMWTPRSLLLQMERHYTEHTDNVVKKKQLPDWPDE